MKIGSKMKAIIPVEVVEKRILFIRGEKVMVDRDLAELYQVSTKVLNQAVRRNNDRFPESFMFQLNLQEKVELVTNCDRFTMLKHSSVLPHAFTEQGVAMLSSVLNSKRAIAVNILIIQTFVKLRNLLASHQDILRKIEQMERKYDEQFHVVFTAIRRMIEVDAKPKQRIGFIKLENRRTRKVRV